MQGTRVLYITYDGLTDPLGRSQILPYLVGLSERGHHITIVSSEKPDRMDKDGAVIRKLCLDAEMRWHPIQYHKRPPILSSALDAALLQRAAFKLHRRHRFEIVHCRSYIPARAGLALKRRFGVRFLFDMRGFWPDEKLEGHNWNLANPIYRAAYRYFKWLESRLFRGSDHIVSLTQAGRDQLLTRPELAANMVPMTVVPCCVDVDHFPLATAESRMTARQKLGIGAGDRVLAYLGSLGSWYMLEEMLDFFQVYASKPGQARFLLVTPDDPRSINQAAAAREIDLGRLVIVSATRDEVPQLMAAADLGIFFIKPVFSKIASSPTKMGEMLALGLPILANGGVGDVERLIEDMGCGVALTEFSQGGYERALDRLERLEGSAESRRDSARRRFDVAIGIERYDHIYRELANANSANSVPD